MQKQGYTVKMLIYWRCNIFCWKINICLAMHISK